MSSARIALVVAVAENGVIGAAGGLPWRLKSDLRKFRRITMGKPLVMGRKTFESIGRVLDGRDNIVVTRRPDFSFPGVFTANTPAGALDLARQRATQGGVDEICVIGGGELFAATLSAADRLYVTEVAALPQGDITFPPIPKELWVEISREELPFSDGDTAAATLVVYQRV